MIPEKNPYNNWKGNGSTTTFDFDFYIEDATQLAVYHTNSQGVQSVLTYGTDYSIKEFKKDEGSYITFPLASSAYSVLGDDEVISLCLTLPISQENEYGKSSYLNLEAIEYSLDYITRICQIIDRELKRAVKVQEGSDIDTDKLTQNINIVTDHIDNIDTAALDRANIDAVAANKTNIDTVAGSITNVNNCGNKITDVVTVATNIDKVKTVSTNINNVNTAASISQHITTVSNDKNNIDIVAANDANIKTTATNINNVNTTAGSIANVNKVADKISNVNTVAGSITNVNTTAGSIANVNTVAGKIANVNTTATNINNVNIVAANDANIKTAATNINNVKTVANNIDAVNVCNTNIEAIKDAPNQAAAAQSALATCENIRDAIQILSFNDGGNALNPTTLNKISGGNARNSGLDVHNGGNALYRQSLTLDDIRNISELGEMKIYINDLLKTVDILTSSLDSALSRIGELEGVTVISGGNA